MNESTYKHLLAEKNTLEQLLEKAPEYDFLGRASLSSRLKSVESQISMIEHERLRKSAVITFRGEPVDGSRGISAEFAGKVIDGLNEMIASIVASHQNLLKYKGAIPNRRQNTLMITGTATGSFGFQLELPSPDLIHDRNGAENALYTVQQLIKHSIDGSDDAVYDLVHNLHPRALKKTTDFLEIVQSHSAVFALQFEQHLVRIENHAQLEHIINRLSEENIHQTIEEYHGKFLGVLPHTRTFEFQPSDSDTLIKGKIGALVAHPEVINTDYLNHPVDVSFEVSQFGQSKPKYLLTDITNIHK